MQLNGKKLLQSFQEGGLRVINKRKELNSINVFPVADADTGNNLSSLMRSINDISKSGDEMPISTVLSLVANKALEHGKGNSGMIFAQYFNGVSRFYFESDDPEKTLINAFVSAVDDAYSAVQDPQEGTILTVIKDWAYKLQQTMSNHSFSESLLIARDEAKASVLNTKYQHKVMKKNEVVDAGAKGFLLFLEGLTDVFNDFTTDLKQNTHKVLHEIKKNHGDKRSEAPNYRYCMEVMFSSDTYKLDQSEVEGFGDSIVIVEGKSKSKLHIHTNNPPKILKELTEKVQVLNIKVDNMEQQYYDQNMNDKSIAIVTDSIADISEADLKRYNIHVLPLTIMVDESEHLDKVTIDNQSLYKLMDDDIQHDISTSLPSQMNILRMFENLEQNYNEVLFISVSSKLSGTYNAILNAKKVYDGSLTIEVIDSSLNSIAQGLLVKAASEYVEKGMAFNELIKTVEKEKQLIDIYVSVIDLDPMIQSGRIPQSLGKAFKKLKLIPIVSLDKEGKGKLSNIGLSQKSIQKKILRRVIAKRNDIHEIVIGFTSDSKDAKEWQAILQKQNISNVKIIQTSSIIALSAGRDSTALAVNYKKGK